MIGQRHFPSFGPRKQGIADVGWWPPSHWESSSILPWLSQTGRLTGPPDRRPSWPCPSPSAQRLQEGLQSSSLRFIGKWIGRSGLPDVLSEPEHSSEGWRSRPWWVFLVVPEPQQKWRQRRQPPLWGLTWGGTACWSSDIKYNETVTK